LLEAVFELKYSTRMVLYSRIKHLLAHSCQFTALSLLRRCQCAVLTFGLHGSPPLCLCHLRRLPLSYTHTTHYTTSAFALFLASYRKRKAKGCSSIAPHDIQPLFSDPVCSTFALRGCIPASWLSARPALLTIAAAAPRIHSTPKRRSTQRHSLQ